ncbi:MAG TPA: hypothetical protein VM533_00240 [Fimbriiglobus sp.]|nr:hypothetical protein [Fimbriiglobus sp.]
MLLGRLALPWLIDAIPPRTPPKRQVGKLRDCRVQPEYAIETEDDSVVGIGVVTVIKELPHPVVCVMTYE